MDTIRTRIRTRFEWSDEFTVETDPNAILELKVKDNNIPNEKVSVYGCSFIKVGTLSRDEFAGNEGDFVLMTSEFTTIGTLTLRWTWTAKEDEQIFMQGVTQATRASEH